MWVVTDVLDINFYGEQQIRKSHKSDSLLQKRETYKCLKFFTRSLQLLMRM